MHRPLLALILIIASSAAQTTSPKHYTVAPSGQEDAGSKKAREIIDRAIDALGGDAYMNVRTTYQEGRSGGFSHTGESGIPVQYWRWAQGMDKERDELLKKHDWVLLYLGDIGYDITYHGVKPVDPDQLQSYLIRRDYSLENVLRNWTRDAKTIYILNPDQFVEAQPAYSVTIFNSKNQSETILVNQQNYLPMKKEYSARDEKLDYKYTVDDVFDQYRNIQGIQTPFVTSSSRDGQMSGERFLYRVVYNAEFPPAIFTKEYKGEAPRPPSAK